MTNYCLQADDAGQTSLDYVQLQTWSLLRPPNLVFLSVHVAHPTQYISILWHID